MAIFMGGVLASPVVRGRSQKHGFLQSLFDERPQLTRELMIQRVVAADGIIYIARGVERCDLLRGRGDQGGDGAGVILSHGEDHVGLVDQLDAEHARAVAREVRAQLLDGVDGGGRGPRAGHGHRAGGEHLHALFL